MNFELEVEICKIGREGLVDLLVWLKHFRSFDGVAVSSVVCF